MFENLVGQEIVKKLLVEDIEKIKLPPAILLTGQYCSGKLTAALEIARSVSCLENAKWICPCKTCIQHKNLTSPDLIIMGVREGTLEIKAAAETLINNKSLSSYYLFVRAIRKLTIRFDSRLWDSDEPRFIKAAPIINEIEEGLAELTLKNIEEADSGKLLKQIETLTSKCLKLQEECMYDCIPINQVRKAALWIRLMPAGTKKILIVENAEKMQEGARNAFLKILEEPPAHALFILTSIRKNAIIPTILSRVRPYNFAERNTEHQIEVVKRVFKKNENEVQTVMGFNFLVSFLYNYLPVKYSDICNAAGAFWEYVFFINGRENKHMPSSLDSVLKKYKNKSNFESRKNISSIMNSINKCKPHTVFVLFLYTVLNFLQVSIRTENCSAEETEKYKRIVSAIQLAETQADIFNMNEQSILEDLAQTIKDIL